MKALRRKWASALLARPGAARRRVAGIVLLAALFFLVHCDTDRVAGGGTGTSTGNTITAQVIGIDGTPAAGASIALRPVGFVPDSLRDPMGLPKQGALLSGNPGADGVSDAKGRFTMALDTGSYFLEASLDRLSGRYVAWSESVRVNADDPVLDLGSLQLTEAAVLSGRIEAKPDTGLKNETLWAGFPGTGNFVRVGADSGFRLQGVASGERTLTLFRKRLNAGWQHIRVRGWKAAAGELVSLPPLPMPAPESGDTTVDVSQMKSGACPDTISSLVQSAGKVPAADTPELMRAYLATAPPQWVELSPCTGTWRALVTLPGDSMSVMETFSSPTADFVISKFGSSFSYQRILNEIVQIPAKASVTLSNLQGVQYYNGKFYCRYAGESHLRIYPDTSFLDDGIPEDTLAIRWPPDLLAHLAIHAGRVQSIYPDGTGATKVYEFEMANGTSVIAPLDTAVGPGIPSIARSSGPGIWILNSRNELLIWDPVSNSLTRKIKIQAPAALQGLTRSPQ